MGAGIGIGSGVIRERNWSAEGLRRVKTGSGIVLEGVPSCLLDPFEHFSTLPVIGTLKFFVLSPTHRGNPF